MELKVTEKEITEVGCEEIYSGYYQTYLIKLDIEEKLKPYMCKIQFATAGQETVEIVYVEGQPNYLPQAPVPGDYAIKIVFYEIIDGILKLRYSLPVFHKIIRRGSFDGEKGRDPKPEELDQYNKILAETIKAKDEVGKIGIEVEADRKEVAENTKKVEKIVNGIEQLDVATKTYVSEKDQATLKEAKDYTLQELKRPQHDTMIVTAMQEGLGFKSDYTANEIKRHADGGGVVILRFNAPDGTGEQSYNYETYKDNFAIFRRAVVYTKTSVISRIVIKIDNNYNVTKEEEEIQVATSGDLANANDEINYLTEETSRHEQDIGLLRAEQTLQNSAIEKNSTGVQNLDHDKMGIIRYPVASDKVAQLEATDIISNYGNYEGQTIEFLTNGEAPNKTIGYGYLMTDKQGNQFLIVLNLNGTITQFNKSYYEKHSFETYSYINEMVDLDNLTIDIRGEAPFMASVQNAINRPFKNETSEKGMLMVLGYSIEQQMQIYKDMESNKNYYRIITGTADNHSFGIWNKIESGTTKPNEKLTFTGAVNAEYDGSKPITVDIPTNGGSEKQWELIETIEGTGKGVYRSEEPNGTSYYFDSLYIEVEIGEKNTDFYGNFTVTHSDGSKSELRINSVANANTVNAFAFENNNGTIRPYMIINAIHNLGSVRYLFTSNREENPHLTKALPILIFSTTAYLPVGATMKIYAIRRKK